MCLALVPVEDVSKHSVSHLIRESDPWWFRPDKRKGNGKDQGFQMFSKRCYKRNISFAIMVGSPFSDPTLGDGETRRILVRKTAVIREHLCDVFPAWDSFKGISFSSKLSWTTHNDWTQQILDVQTSSFEQGNLLLGNSSRRAIASAPSCVIYIYIYIYIHTYTYVCMCIYIYAHVY